MKIIGIKRSNFTTREGNEIHGINLYLTYPLSGEQAQGQCAERLYMTDEKLARCGYVPKLGDEVRISYNRFGKPDAIFSVKAQ